jgi:CRP-like cAMP-binding protein
MSLLAHLSSIISVSDALKQELSRVGIKKEIAKGEVIVNCYERCDSIFFIEKGLVRGYYFNEDKEITNWFAQEDEFATSFYAFITNKTTNENIQAIEDCSLIEIPFSVLQNLYTHFHETERLGRILTENYYIKLEERILSLQFKTAKERYQKFALSKPTLLQRASLGQIASYLGITQETLSRIRAEN